MRIITIAIFGMALATGSAQAAFNPADITGLHGSDYQSGRFLEGEQLATGPGIGCNRNPPPSQC